MNTYDIPTIALTVDTKKQEAKGSARSFGELNITELLSKVSGKLLRYGGHHNAAGFSLESAKLQELLDLFEELLKTEYGDYHPVAIRYVDSLLSVPELTDSFFSTLQLLEPFGHENNAPLFGLRGKVQQFNVIGATGQHVKYDVSTEQGTIKVLHFNGVKNLAGVEQGREYLFYGEPKQDEFNGRVQVSFIAEYFE